MKNLSKFTTDFYFGRLREKVDKEDWKNSGAAAVVNAFYNGIKNTIRMNLISYLFIYFKY